MTTIIPRPSRQTEPVTPALPESPNGDSGRELATELARLRERFAAYEHLDKQLDDMVSGLTDLLQGATELRRRTNKDVVEALARCEALVASDRAHHHDALAALLTDLEATHRRAAALTTAVARLETQLAELADRLPTNGGGAPSPAPAPAAPALAPGIVQVAIRGVPSVATALTLQRFIAGLKPVAAIQTRELASGEFRLQVELTSPFPAAELTRLNSGSLSIVESAPDRLILHYDPLATN
jgi:hypothetical protein